MVRTWLAWLCMYEYGISTYFAELLGRSTLDSMKMNPCFDETCVVFLVLVVPVLVVGIYIISSVLMPMSTGSDGIHRNNQKLSLSRYV